MGREERGVRGVWMPTRGQHVGVVGCWRDGVRREERGVWMPARGERVSKIFFPLCLVICGSISDGKVAIANVVGKNISAVKSVAKKGEASLIPLLEKNIFLHNFFA